VAEARSLERGRWRVHDDPAVAKATFGLLVLEGVLARRAEVGRRGSLELLGCGDVLCPDLADGDAYANVSQRGTWRVFVPARMAVLDDDLVAELAGTTVQKDALLFHHSILLSDDAAIEWIGERFERVHVELAAAGE
jgi:hypothetical protein